MRRTILGQTGIEASRLGFGCVQLTAHRSRGEAVRILEHAFAEGITYFDVSRIYGFGRAEGILGEFLRGKRERVTVATKFGIQPPSGIAGNRRLIDLAKKILSPFPGLLRRAKGRGSKMVQAGVFTPENAVLSLETSLRELGTDCVDVFLLHEATLTDAAGESLIDALQGQVKRGTIRCFGVASSFQNFQGDAGGVPSAYQVLQFEDNAVARNVHGLRHREGWVLVTHGVFQPLAALREAMVRQPEVTKDYSARTGLDLEDTAVVASLLLQTALGNNSEGVVLFSSMDRGRISGNVKNAESGQHGEGQIAKFSEFVDVILGSTPIRSTP